MKKSAKINLLFLSSFAAAVLEGCGGGDGDWVEAKRCADDNNIVVEDRWCEEGGATGATGTTGPRYRYYYGGHGYYVGDRAYGGSRVAQPDVNYMSPSRIPRGGFGSTGKAFVGHSSIGT
jgi:hypothetical protein